MGLGVTPAIVRGARRGARTALARVRFLGCGLGMGPRAFATNLMAVAFAPDSLLCHEEANEARGARDDGVGCEATVEQRGKTIMAVWFQT